MIYYIIFSILTILAILQVNYPKAYIFKEINKKIVLKWNNREFYIVCNKNKLLKLIIIFLCIFAGFRSEVGIDFFTYKNEFIKIKQGIFGTGEILYNIISKLLPSFVAVLCLYAFSTVLIFSKFIRKFSPYIFVSFMLFFSNFYLRFNMGIIRQGLAIAISLLCIKYAIKKEKIKFVITLTIASVFHRSAILVCFVYFFANKKFSTKLKLLILTICVFIGNSDFIGYIAKYISTLPLPGMNRYYVYLNNMATLNNKFSIFDLKTLFIFISILYVIKKYRKDDKILLSLSNIYFLGACFQYSFIKLEFVADRATYYFLALEIILLPMIINSIKNKLIRNIVLIIVIIYSFYYVNYYVNYTSNIWMNAPYVPYKMFFY